MRALLTALLLLLPLAAPAQQTASSLQGTVRVLDKITGEVGDVTLRAGSPVRVGLLTITLGECRYPARNPSGDAFEWLTILYGNDSEPVFQGWMIASAPALNAMDHHRYDVWALRCTTS